MLRNITLSADDQLIARARFCGKTRLYQCADRAELERFDVLDIREKSVGRRGSDLSCFWRVICADAAAATNLGNIAFL